MPDRAIAELAERQHGVVAPRQLVGSIGRRAIEHRLACGQLHVVHRGVYAVGHRLLDAEGRWMAAVLSAGPGAVLSHAAGAIGAGVTRSELEDRFLEFLDRAGCPAQQSTCRCGSGAAGSRPTASGASSA